MSETLRLDECCTLVTDGTHHSPPNFATGAFKYITAKNVKAGALDLGELTYVSAAVHRDIYARCPVERDDVLYIKDGVTTGVAAVNPFDEQFSMLSSVALLKPKRDVLEPRYLMHWLNSPETFASLTGQMTGTAIRRIVLKTLRAERISLPSLDEQRRIVAKLDALRARSRRAKDALDAVPALLDRLRQSILAAAFRGDLTADWREQNPDVEPASELLKRIRIERRKRWEEAELAKLTAKGKRPKDDAWKAKYVEPEPVDESDLPELPEGWAGASWAAVGFSQNGKPFPSGEYQSTGIRLLRPGNMDVSGTLTWSEANTKCMSEKWAAQHPDHIVGPGELVINLTAQSLKDEFLGRVCMSGPGERCLLNQRIARLTPVLLNTRSCSGC